MTLGQRVDQGPPIARREAIEILLELCDVLRAAHAAGVVHRDLKLDNVFVCDDAVRGRPPRQAARLGRRVRRRRRRIRSAASSPAR